MEPADLWSLPFVPVENTTTGRVVIGGRGVLYIVFAKGRTRKVRIDLEVLVEATKAEMSELLFPNLRVRMHHTGTLEFHVEPVADGQDLLVVNRKLFLDTARAVLSQA